MNIDRAFQENNKSAIEAIEREITALVKELEVPDSELRDEIRTLAQAKLRRLQQRLTSLRTQ